MEYEIFGDVNGGSVVTVKDGGIFVLDTKVTKKCQQPGDLTSGMSHASLHNLLHHLGPIEEIHMATQSAVPYHKLLPFKELGKRDMNKLCRYHKNYSHDTNECSQTTIMVMIIVVDVKSPNNVMLKMSTLYGLRAISSVYHLSVKFPTVTGIGCLLGNQRTLRECYYCNLLSLTKKTSSGSMASEGTNKTSSAAMAPGGRARPLLRKLKRQQRPL
uniref:Uncharacterized protein n=1 Tax=Cannabis sativa TaxID=3483 RepID=A0A803PML1_CANSA